MKWERNEKFEGSNFIDPSNLEFALLQTFFKAEVKLEELQCYCGFS